jgi:hypothetical protein
MKDEKLLLHTSVFELVQYTQGRTAVIGVNLTLIGRLKPQLHKQNPPIALALRVAHHAG